MEYVLALAEWLEANPHLSGPIFVMAFALIMAIGVPGGNFLLLFGGFLFGWKTGAALSTLGAVLAALATYVLIRTAFGRWLDARAQHSRFSVREWVRDGNALLLLLPRLIPVFPFFALNVGMAAAGVPIRTYLWTVAVGMVPISMIVCSIGAELHDLEEISRAGLLDLLASPGLYVPLSLLVGLTLFGWLWLRRSSSA